MQNTGDVTVRDVVGVATRNVWQTVRWVFIPTANVSAAPPAAPITAPVALKHVRFGSRAPIAGVRPKLEPRNACLHPVGLPECIDAAVNTIVKSLDETTDSSYRKSPLILSRCSRGGKTTMLTKINEEFRNRGFATILVSFNNESFTQPPGELDCESLFRQITNQIDNSLGINEPRQCNWGALDNYIGDRQGFILLIDEINVLGPQVSRELADVLKEYFIDRSGRQLIMSSRMPMLGTSASELWQSKHSDRDVENIQMPVSYDISQLTQMDPSLSRGISPAIAAYYGGVPSLMYAMLQRSNESSINRKFNKFMSDDAPNSNDFLPFVRALFNGIANSVVLAKYLPFSSEVSNDHRVKWPLCYIHCIMRHLKQIPAAELIVACIDDLLEHSSHTTGDEVVWEATTRIAILLHAVRAADVMEQAEGPLGVSYGGEAVNAEVMLLALGAGVHTPEQARTAMLRQANSLGTSALVLFVPTPEIPSFEQFDGFICLIRNKEIVSTSAFQCKEHAQGTARQVPEWVNGGGHLIRSNAQVSCKVKGQNENGWFYYSQEDTDKFFGWSLQITRQPEHIQT